MTTHHTRAKRTANQGWINVQLSEGPNGKLREMIEKSRPQVSITAIIESAVEREWEVWNSRWAGEAGKGVGV